MPTTKRSKEKTDAPGTKEEDGSNVSIRVSSRRSKEDASPKDSPRRHRTIKSNEPPPLHRQSKKSSKGGKKQTGKPDTLKTVIMNPKKVR